MEKAKQSPSIVAAGADRTLDVNADVPDLHDRIYEPALIELPTRTESPDVSISPVLDQQQEGACTGFALASIITLLRNQREQRQRMVPPAEFRASPRMLYEMAKLHDEWPGENYEGSSIRGALKGFFHNGACSDRLAPYRSGQKNWFLTVEQAKEARGTGLGAYYRLRPEIIDYHAALRKAGAILVSASVHRGWSRPRRGEIVRSTSHIGGHAFIIVAYDDRGFLVQNSWGESWGQFEGRPGIARWTYADWAENVMDAWVLRLAVPTPEAFDLTHVPVKSGSASAAKFDQLIVPRRQDIIGHFIHIDDGKLVEQGRYATSMENTHETGQLLIDDETRPDGKPPNYDHLMFYAHGGLNSADASARRIKALKEAFKRNRIYPVHFMWETGFTEELGDVFKEIFLKSLQRVGAARDALDWMIEQMARGVGLRLWREMKVDAQRSFAGTGDGKRALNVLLGANAKRKKPLQVHLVCHSAGAILFGELLRQWAGLSANAPGKLGTASLMAPACTTKFYDQTWKKSVGSAVAKLFQYSLVDRREQDDTVGPYGKSLLYFVSNAFEETKGEALLGMEKHTSKLSLPASHRVWYAGRDSSRTDSKSHGGFDNDRLTMNDILGNMLGKKPSAAMGFQPKEMIGY